MFRSLTTVIFLLLAGVGLFYYFSDRGNVTLKFSEQDLRDRLDEQLPFSRDYLFIFNVTLDNPRIDLVEGSDRVAGGMDVLLNVRVNNSDEVLSGALDMSGALSYEPESGEFYLIDPLVENVRIAGLSSRWANRANQAISLALAEYYRDRPVYRLSNQDFNHAAARLVLREVIVRDETLYVTLGLNKSADTAALTDESRPGNRP